MTRQVCGVISGLMTVKMKKNMISKDLCEKFKFCDSYILHWFAFDLQYLLAPVVHNSVVQPESRHFCKLVINP